MQLKLADYSAVAFTAGVCLRRGVCSLFLNIRFDSWLSAAAGGCRRLLCGKHSTQWSGKLAKIEIVAPRASERASNET